MIHSVLLALASEESELTKLEAGDYSILKNKTCEDIKMLIASISNESQEQVNVSRRILLLQSVHAKTNFI